MRLLVLLGLAGCAVTPTRLLDLADASSDEAVARAVAQNEWMLRQGEMVAQRATAAKVLGRLGVASVSVVESLALKASEKGEDPLVRKWSIWALGELGNQATLTALVGLLRQLVPADLAEEAMLGLAKHEALLAKDADAQLAAVEALVYYAGNANRDPPPIYHLLSGRLRSLAVNLVVLERAVAACEKERSESSLLAIHRATHELLLSLERSTTEIVAAESEWRGRLGEAGRILARARALDEPYLSHRILSRVGALGSSQAFSPLAVALFDRAYEGPAERFLRVWALSRSQLFDLESRRTLLRLLVGADGREWRLVGDLARDDADLLQRLSGVGR